MSDQIEETLERLEKDVNLLLLYVIGNDNFPGLLVRVGNLEKVVAVVKDLAEIVPNIKDIVASSASVELAKKHKEDRRNTIIDRVIYAVIMAMLAAGWFKFISIINMLNSWGLGQ